MGIYILEMGTLTKEQAHEIALQHLATLEDEIGCDLVLTSASDECEQGYIFYYDSKKWVEEKQIIFALAGNLPLLISSDSGEVSYFEGD